MPCPHNYQLIVAAGHACDTAEVVCEHCAHALLRIDAYDVYRMVFAAFEIERTEIGTITIAKN